MVRSRARKKSHDGGFILAACARNLLGPLVRAHVSRLATDEGFIRLNLPGQLVTRSHAQREPDAVIHEPCGLLGDMERPPDFATANAILAIGN
jgi:hypothetical protein